MILYITSNKKPGYQAWPAKLNNLYIPVMLKVVQLSEFTK